MARARNHALGRRAERRWLRDLAWGRSFCLLWSEQSLLAGGGHSPFDGPATAKPSALPEAKDSFGWETAGGSSIEAKESGKLRLTPPFSLTNLQLTYDQR